MQLPNTRGQMYRDFTYDASGTTGSAAQLVLPERKFTSSLIFMNISDTDMYIEIGSARAHATLTNGAVTSVTVDNAGFGFTLPPNIQFLGGTGVGWNIADGNYLGAGEPGFPTPSNFATAHAVLSTGTIGSIVVDNSGAGYVKAPYVFITNHPDDPFGCATPSATSGLLIPKNGGSYQVNGTVCTTDPIAVYCSGSSKSFTCKWTG